MCTHHPIRWSDQAAVPLPRRSIVQVIRFVTTQSVVPFVSEVDAQTFGVWGCGRPKLTVPKAAGTGLWVHGRVQP